LAQSGLVVHWRRTRPPRWRYRAGLNGLGAAATGLATVVFLLTKFTEGAWVVVLAVPAFIMVFVRIHHYYDGTRRALGLGEIPGKPEGRPAVVVVPVTGVSRLTEYGISQALSISRHVLAVTVVHIGAQQEPGRASELQRQWERWDPGVPLRVLRTEYASIAGPIVAFVDRLRRQRGEPVIVLIPVVLPDRLRYRFLHNHFDTVLTRALRDRPDVIAARVPMRVRAGGRGAPVRVASTGPGRRRRSAGRTSRPEDSQVPPGSRVTRNDKRTNWL
jgi:hypothetical protein